MKDYRPVRVLLKGQARAKFEELERIAGAQQDKGAANSEEIQLLKSIRQKIGLIKENKRKSDARGQHSKETHSKKL